MAATGRGVWGAESFSDCLAYGTAQKHDKKKEKNERQGLLPGRHATGISVRSEGGHKENLAGGTRRTQRKKMYR